MWELKNDRPVSTGTPKMHSPFIGAKAQAKLKSNIQRLIRTSVTT